MALSFMPDLNVMLTPSVQVHQLKSLIWNNGHLGAQSGERNTADVAQVVCELAKWHIDSIFYECHHLHCL